jgi:hypothetical protein
MIAWFQSVRKCFQDRTFVTSFIIGWLLLIASVIVSYYAGVYATERASNSVTDIILSNVRVFDLDGVFVYGPVVFWLIATVVAIRKPERVPFILKSIALFTIVRSVFISLTHIGPFPIQLDDLSLSSVAYKFMFGSDLFFSGHTGLPFLMALIYWDSIPLRWFFTAASLFFGAVVLLAHLHYSIDVLSAFFITYAIFHIARQLFKNDYRVFRLELEAEK